MILKCVLKYIANNWKSPQNFRKAESSLGSFGSKIFHGFVILARWENRTYCVSSVLFGHKNESSEDFCKKHINMATSSKNIQKYENASRRTHRNNQILLYRESFR